MYVTDMIIIDENYEISYYHKDNSYIGYLR